MNGRAQPSVLAGTGACFLSIGLLVPVLPQYVTGPLAHGPGTVGVLVAVPSVTAILARPFAGRMADEHGHRPTAAAGAAVLAVAALALLGAGSLPALLACRAVAGIGEALAYVGLAAAGASTAEAATGTSGRITRFSIAVYAGLLAGAPLGTLALNDLGFTGVWLLSAATAATATAICLTLPSNTTTSADPMTSTGPEASAGVAASAGGMTSASAGASERPTTSAGSGGSAGSEAETAVAGGGRRERSPLVHRAGLLPGVAYGASVWGYTAFNTYIPLYGRHVGERDVRTEYLVYGVVLLAVRILGHRVISRLPPRRIAVASLAFTAAGLAGMVVVPTAPGLVGGTALLAVGQALGLPAFLAMAVDAVPAGQRGSVLATVTGFFDVGFLTAALGLGLATRTLGLEAGFAVAAGAAAAPLLLFIPRRRAVPPPVPPFRTTTEERPCPDPTRRTFRRPT